MKTVIEGIGVEGSVEEMVSLMKLLGAAQNTQSQPVVVEHPAKVKVKRSKPTKLLSRERWSNKDYVKSLYDQNYSNGQLAKKWGVGKPSVRSDRAILRAQGKIAWKRCDSAKN